VALYGRYQKAGRIEGFDVCLLDPPGGDLDAWIVPQDAARSQPSRRRDVVEDQPLAARAQLVREADALVRARAASGARRRNASYVRPARRACASC
jgi:hypothetical protein